MPSFRPERLRRALLSLQGLACGDCFGESFFLPRNEALDLIARRQLPVSPWPFTDDTLMAVSILNTLRDHGQIPPASLARSFTDLDDPDRGYGPAMHGHLLRLAIVGADHWQREAQALFEGRGSFGNGAAMRVAPLGAFFADDLNLLIEQARLSAIATHAHEDAVAGAIAVALAAAFAWNTRGSSPPPASEVLDHIAALTPAGPLRDGVLLAATLSPATSPTEAGRRLGNGGRATAVDTVPFALWCAATWPDSYEEALWQTVSGLGDRDTTCAIVGGIISLRTDVAGIPQTWLARAESPWHLIGSPST